MHKNDNLMPYIAGVTYSVILGCVFLAIRGSQQYAGQLEIIAYRFTFAFIAAALFMACNVFKSNIKENLKKRESFNKIGLLMLAVSTYILFIAFQITGMFYASSVLGAVILALTPIAVQIIASFVLNEKSTWKQTVFSIISVGAVIGIVLLDSGQIEFSIFGVIVFALATVSMAISNTTVRYIRREYTSFDISFLISLIGCVVFNAVAIVKNIADGSVKEYFELALNPEFMICTAYLGIGCIMISSLLVAYTLMKLPAVNASIFGNLSTVISLVLGVIVLGENFSMYHLECSILIIIGVIGVSIYGNDNRISKKG